MSLKRQNQSNDQSASSSQTVSRVQLDGIRIHDQFCWKCRKEAVDVWECILCARVYHFSCYPGSSRNIPFRCAECTSALKARNEGLIAKMDLNDLNISLEVVLQKMRKPKYKSFWIPINSEVRDRNDKILVNPMDLSKILNKVRSRCYSTAEGLLADVKWILHNCIICSGISSRESQICGELVRDCTAELAEMKLCLTCYYKSIIPNISITGVCSTPHLLLLVKRQDGSGHPAKLIKLNDFSSVYVWFFGTHKREWVKCKNCYLYDGNVTNATDRSFVEIELHIQKLRNRFGRFEYARPMTIYDPRREFLQLRRMLPHYQPLDIEDILLLPRPLSVSTDKETVEKEVNTWKRHCKEMPLEESANEDIIMISDSETNETDVLSSEEEIVKAVPVDVTDYIRSRKREMVMVIESQGQQTNIVKAKYEKQIANLQSEKMRAVDSMKFKFWCRLCTAEARNFCCKYTYYCSTDYQIADKEAHKPFCLRTSTETCEQAEPTVREEAFDLLGTDEEFTDETC